MSLERMVILPREAKESSGDYSSRVLRYNIMQLNLEPGEILNDNQLASALQVSRTPIREAFMCLRSQRLIESYPQSHSFVTKINLRYVDEDIFLRHAVECRIIAEAIKAATSADIASMQINLAQQKQALDLGNHRAFIQLDRDFHHCFFMIVKKPLCWENLQQITTHHMRIQPLVVGIGDNNVEMLVPYREHCAIFNSLVNGELPQNFNQFLYKHIGYRRLLPALISQYPSYFEQIDISVFDG